MHWQDGPLLDWASRTASLRRVRHRADEQFVRVERAYRVLSDPVKRLVRFFVLRSCIISYGVLLVIC